VAKDCCRCRWHVSPEACDYSTGTLYQHFASKEDLLVALLTDCAQERIQLFRIAASWDAGARDRMFAFGVAEAVFVKRNPEYFRLEQFAQAEVIWSCASPADGAPV
jgi:AcrR family transcriptional regulator